MIKTFTFFEDTKELETLTGLTHEELWDNDFNLDDMDWGFVCSEDLDAYPWDLQPSYAYFILSRMEDYCCGCHHTEYKGKHYYTLHHG